MKITTVIENTPGTDGCVPLHGLSFHVDTGTCRILFDAGPSDETLRNAEKLGLDLRKTDIAVLSHGHYDHSGGFTGFARMNPSAPIYMQRGAEGENLSFDGPGTGYRYIGIDRRLATSPQTRFLDGDAEIGDGLTLFTVEKRVYPVPSTNMRMFRKVADGYIRDDFAHEQCLYVRSGSASVLLSGCAHNGILNVLEEFVRKFGRGNLPQAVLSGFHLQRKDGYGEADFSEQDEIARLLAGYPCRFFTCHCTGVEPYERMKRIMGGKLRYVRTGETLEFT